MLQGSKDKVSLKKKDKPKKKFVGKGLKIVDEDSFGLGGYKPPTDSEDEEAEDLPQIAAVVDERPVEIQVLESFSQSKWKRLEENQVKGVDSSLSLIDRDKNLSDISPRQRQRRNSDDISPPRQRLRRGSDDVSPPRQRVRRGSDDVSPPRQRVRRGSDDVSPPRQRVQRRSRNVSPVKQVRRGSRDVSPAKQRSRNVSSSRRRTQKSSSDDFSPPRQSKHRHISNRKNSVSPNRRRRNSGNRSPPRKPRHRSNERRGLADISHNSSASRNNRGNSMDTSPPRKRNLTPPQTRFPDGRRKERERNVARPEILEVADDEGKIKTTLDGKKAGLQQAATLRDEMLDFRKRENELFEQLPDEVSGRNAKAVVRDRRTEADIAKEQEKQKKEELRKEQYDKWGKGLKQVEEREARVRSALHEMAKPLARYKDDEDLDDHLKKVDREGDPMLEYLTAKRRKATGTVEKPKYNGPPPPPNRFNIPPGFRWDGVDRSNGYEKEWFSRINAKKALQEEAYKWSVEDL